MHNKTFGTNIRVTASSNQGGRKYMEDAFSIVYQRTADDKDMEFVYFGIFDGHGGREAAEFAKTHLLEFIIDNPKFYSRVDEEILEAIREGFLSCHNAMWRAIATWPKTLTGLPSTSGTTSSIAFIMRGKVFIGHVGDSGIVLGKREPGDAHFTAKQLTTDHKPDCPTEKARIESVGGAVVEKAGVQRVAWYRPKLNHRGPVRRSTQVDQIPFLAVARSLGDLWSYNYAEGQFAVSPEPDCHVMEIDPVRHKCLVLATDGLWNMMNPQCAVSIVEEAERAQEAQFIRTADDCIAKKQLPSVNPSQMLVSRCMKRWAARNIRADNTTVITVMLDPLGPARVEVMARFKTLKKLRKRQSSSDSSNLFLTDLEDVAPPETPPPPRVMQSPQVPQSAPTRLFPPKPPTDKTPQSLIAAPRMQPPIATPGSAARPSSSGSTPGTSSSTSPAAPTPTRALFNSPYPAAPASPSTPFANSAEKLSMASRLQRTLIDIGGPSGGGAGGGGSGVAAVGVVPPRDQFGRIIQSPNYYRNLQYQTGGQPAAMLPQVKHCCCPQCRINPFPRQKGETRTIGPVGVIIQRTGEYLLEHCPYHPVSQLSQLEHSPHTTAPTTTPATTPPTTSTTITPHKTEDKPEEAVAGSAGPSRREKRPLSSQGQRVRKVQALQQKNGDNVAPRTPQQIKFVSQSVRRSGRSVGRLTSGDQTPAGRRQSRRSHHTTSHNTAPHTGPSARTTNTQKTLRRTLRTSTTVCASTGTIVAAVASTLTVSTTTPVTRAAAARRRSAPLLSGKEQKDPRAARLPRHIAPRPRCLRSTMAKRK